MSSLYVSTSLVDQIRDVPGELAFKAEVDARPNGLNNGATSFQPGGRPYLLLYRSPSIELYKTLFSMDGLHLVGGGTQLVDVTKDVIFDNTSKATLDKPVTELISSTWMGHSLGELSINNLSVSVGTSGVGIVRLKYKSLAEVYRLEGVPLTVGGLSEFSVLVHLIGRRVS